MPAAPAQTIKDLLTKDVQTLSRRLFVWALVERRPWIHLLGAASRGFLPAALLSRARLREFATWLDSGFVRRQREALSGYPKRWHLLAPLPASGESLDALDGISRQFHLQRSDHRFIPTGAALSLFSIAIC